MKKSEIDIGGVYVAKVSGKLARLRIERESPHGGWEATNLETKRGVRVKSPRRLRYVAQGLEVDHVPTAEEQAPPIEYDPDRCWVEGCIKPPMVNCLGKPMCQEHWDDHCAETGTPDESDAAASDRGEPNDQTNESENDMASKKSSKKTGSKKSTTKASKPAKAPKAAKPPKEKKVSALDAAAIVLKKAGKPMGSQEMIVAMAEQGLWESPGGKTPHATLYAAMLREITTKGKESRFRKADKGLFEAA